MSRDRGPVETMEYGAMVGRMIRAWIRRCVHADEPELAQLIAARDEIDVAILEVVYGWRTRYGRSWAYVAQATGRTRVAAFHRWDAAVKELARERGELHLLPHREKAAAKSRPVPL